MSAHFLAAVAGALLAAAGCSVLALRSARTPNLAVTFWTVALLGLFVALVAQALGYHARFGATTFRAMEIGAQVVAPLALGLGLAEVAAKSIFTRFAARLILSALGFVAIVVLATDPLSSAVFTKVWPAASVYYQPIPNGLLKYVLAPVVVIVALIGAVTAASRQGSNADWRNAFAPAALASLGMLVLAVPGISTLVKVSVPLASAFVLLCILATALAWLAGVQASRLRLAEMRGEADADRPRPDAAGGYSRGADDEFGIYRRNGAGRGGDLDYRGTAGDQAAYPGEAGYRDTGYPDQTGYPDEAGYRGTGYPDASGYRGQEQYGNGTGYPDQAGYSEQAGYPGQAGYQDQAGYSEQAGYPDQAGYQNQAGYQDEAGYPQQAGYPDQAGYPEQAGYQGQAGYPEQAGYQDEAGYPQQAGYPDQAGYMNRSAGAAGDEAPAMFGQIEIYTLLEDRVDDFDRLTTKVVRQVRAHEPQTLVYIVHAVPSAPMQRILYEVYRDRAAYEEHKRQPYVLGFEADRRPYVLATNVIELGLQQAKVSPMPSVTDLLTDTGYDLLNDTGFGHPGYGPRHVPRHGGGMPDGGSGSRQAG